MAYDEVLAERVRGLLADESGLTERAMFGGLAFFINGHMLAAVLGEALAVRVGPVAYAEALQQPHAGEMTFTGRPMTGFVQVAPPGFEADTDLAAWLDRGIAFAGALPPK